MKKRYFIVILVLILCIVLSAAVYAEEIPTSEEWIVSPDARQVGSLIVYDFWLYKNSECTTSSSTLQAYINSANSAFNGIFGVDFNCTASSSSAALNEKDGCSSVNSICGIACGSESTCYTNHHKSASYYMARVVSPSYKTFRYVSFPICYYGLINGVYKHSRVDGLAGTNDKEIVVSLYEGSSTPHVLRSTEHELSHWIGARDSVCTSEIVPCVMNTKSNYSGVWCTQCRNDITAYLENNT